MSRTLDRVDRRILDTLQADARISNQELAKRVGLSPAPCWRRLRRLEEEGFIAGYATLLNGSAIGLPILAYALVTLDNHHADTVRQFDRLIQDRPKRLPATHRRGQHGSLRALPLESGVATGRRPLSQHQLRVTHEKVHHAP